MANATKYVDNVLGNNSNSGDNPGAGATGAYADIATAVAAISGGGNTIYFRNTGTDYPPVSLTAGLKGDLTDGQNRLIGYTTTPGAYDGRPRITSGAVSQALITCNDNDFWVFENIEGTHTGTPRGVFIAGVTSQSSPIYLKNIYTNGVFRVIVSTNFGTVFVEGGEFTGCTSTSSVFNPNTVMYLYGVDCHDNTGPGIVLVNGTTSTVSVHKSIFSGNGGVAIDINSTVTATAVTLHDNIIVGNGSDGLKIAANSSVIGLDLVNNIFGGNGGYNINNLDEQIAVASAARLVRNNFHFASTSDYRNNFAPGRGDVDLTGGTGGDPFVNRAARDYTLNTTAGAGALVRAAAFPTSLAGLTNYRDGGPLQHQDSGGNSAPGGGDLGLIIQARQMIPY